MYRHMATTIPTAQKQWMGKKKQLNNNSSHKIAFCVTRIYALAIANGIDVVECFLLFGGVYKRYTIVSHNHNVESFMLKYQRSLDIIYEQRFTSTANHL